MVEAISCVLIYSCLILPIISHQIGSSVFKSALREYNVLCIFIQPNLLLHLSSWLKFSGLTYFFLLKFSWITMFRFWYTAKWFSHIFMCIYIHFYILFHYGLSQNSEYSSLCYAVGPCCLPILYIIAGICQSSVGQSCRIEPLTCRIWCYFQVVPELRSLLGGNWKTHNWTILFTIPSKSHFFKHITSNRLSISLLTMPAVNTHSRNRSLTQTSSGDLFLWSYLWKYNYLSTQLKKKMHDVRVVSQVLMGAQCGI